MSIFFHAQERVNIFVATTTARTVTQARTTTKKADTASYWWNNDDDNDGTWIVPEEPVTTTKATTTLRSTTTTTRSTTTTTTTESLFNDPFGDLKFQTTPSLQSNQIDPRALTTPNSNVLSNEKIVAELMTLSKTLSEKEAVEKIVAKYGLSKEELDQGLATVHDGLTNHADENHDLEQTANNLYNLKARDLFSSRDLHTEDDGHDHDIFEDEFVHVAPKALASQMDEEEAMKTKNFTYQVVREYLDYDLFSSSPEVESSETETVGVVLNRIGSIRDVLKEERDEVKSFTISPWIILPTLSVI